MPVSSYVQYLSDPSFVSGPAPGFTGGPPVNGVPVHAVPMKKGVPIPGGVPLRKLERRSGGRIVAGVAGGIADHLGIDVLKVRVAFAILAAMAGSGIVIYGALWIFTSAGTDTQKPSAAERQRAYGLIALGLGRRSRVVLAVQRHGGFGARTVLRRRDRCRFGVARVRLRRSPGPSSACRSGLPFSRGRGWSGERP